MDKVITVKSNSEEYSAKFRQSGLVPIDVTFTTAYFSDRSCYTICCLKVCGLLVAKGAVIKSPEDKFSKTYAKKHSYSRAIKALRSGRDRVEAIENKNPNSMALLEYSSQNDFLSVIVV